MPDDAARGREGAATIATAAASAAVTVTAPTTTATTPSAPSLSTASPSTASPSRPRHQFTRSLSELSSPIRLHRHHKQHPGGSRERGTNPLASPPAASASGGSSRPSLEVPRPEASYPYGVTAGTASARGSPSNSRRPSVHGSIEPGAGPAAVHGHRQHSASSNANTFQHPAGIAALTAAATAAAAGSPTSLKAVTARSLSEGEATVPAAVAPPAATASSSNSLPDAPVAPHLDRSATRLLQTTLTDLDELSAATSRRLDMAYASVLARMASLQGSVQTLRSLAVTARATNRRFREDAHALVEETEQQVGQYEGMARGTTAHPADQLERLEQLHARVQAGRQAVQTLSGRVDAVREHVRDWEQADQAWQERTRRRLKVLWVIVSGGLLALATMLVLTARSSAGDTADAASSAVDCVDCGTVHAANTTNTTLGNTKLPGLANTSARPKVHITLHDGDEADDNPLVHLFDEL